MAPVVMRRSKSWLCWLAIWMACANVTRATGGIQPSGESGNHAADWACPLEKWSLEERQNRSQVVFTAVIESCQTAVDAGQAVDDDHELCQRYLTQQSHDHAIVSDADVAINVRIKKVVKGLDRMWEGRRVLVEGLRDPRICPSRVRLRDTRIFLASYVNQPMSSDDDEAMDPVHDHRPIDSAEPVRLRLNSSLMSVSLRHLQQLRAFNKGSCLFLFNFVFSYFPQIHHPSFHFFSRSRAIPFFNYFFFFKCCFHDFHDLFQKQAHFIGLCNKTGQGH